MFLLWTKIRIPREHEIFFVPSAGRKTLLTFSENRSFDESPIDHQLTCCITGSHSSTTRWATVGTHSLYSKYSGIVQYSVSLDIQREWGQRGCSLSQWVSERRRRWWKRRHTQRGREGERVTRNGRAALIRPDHSHRTNVFYCLRLSAIEARSHPPSLCARYVVTVIVTISLALRNTLVYYPPPLCNVRNENECISDSDKYLPIPRTTPPHRLLPFSCEINRWS